MPEYSVLATRAHPNFTLTPDENKRASSLISTHVNSMSSMQGTLICSRTRLLRHQAQNDDDVTGFLVVASFEEDAEFQDWLNGFANLTDADGSLDVTPRFSWTVERLDDFEVAYTENDLKRAKAWCC